MLSLDLWLHDLHIMDDDDVGPIILQHTRQIIDSRPRLVLGYFASYGKLEGALG